ncbi:unnamed protein product [Darwinula stevensoni]|uniref:Uncharacterized protein n=1 Tax=Darwinula stevensoni TaxID=69355 RepID=A0A7R8X6F7_9CRUS|nr:unnamed protein product [Darwinula stevensoni]CAG0888042.1 unnamed protein product [Darwinula stevensoni]
MSLTLKQKARETRILAAEARAHEANASAYRRKWEESQEELRQKRRPSKGAGAVEAALLESTAKLSY